MSNVSFSGNTPEVALTPAMARVLEQAKELLRSDSRAWCARA